MKRVISALVVMVFIAGMAFGADESATTAPASAGETAVVKTPVASAAVEVTKEATDVVTTGVQRRQDRKQSRRKTLLGGDQEQ